MLKLFRKEKIEKPKILFFCGAGLSAESGLQTFRDSDGLWENYDIDEVCNLKTFKKNKDMVFDFYNERKKQILSVEPNAAHLKIAQIQKKYGSDNVLIFTSNIDNLLEKAGCTHITYVHGNIDGMLCLDCGHKWSIKDKPYDKKEMCGYCKSNYIKPDIVFFNEPAPAYSKLREAFEKTGPVIKSCITYNIKVIVGTSFKVIKPSVFLPKRGRTIVVDKSMPEMGDAGPYVEQFIIEPAGTGMIKAGELIEKWY